MVVFKNPDSGISTPSLASSTHSGSLEADSCETPLSLLLRNKSRTCKEIMNGTKQVNSLGRSEFEDREPQ